MKKGLRKVVERYLEKEPKARERVNKDRALANLLLEKYPNALASTPKDKLISIIGDALTMDRCWRKILSERKELRGTDYGMKDELEIEAQQELGYNV